MKPQFHKLFSRNVMSAAAAAALASMPGGAMSHARAGADPFGIPTIAELSQYNVNRPDQIEAIKQSLYSRNTYAAAGQTQLQFFQSQVGSSGAPTLASSNMRGAGVLPAPISFLIQSIELYAFPTAAITEDGTATNANFLEDLYSLYSGLAWLELFIGSKAYLDEAPLMKFPPRTGLGCCVSLGSASTSAGVPFIVDYASATGPTYEMVPPILLVPTQNFVVTLNWPTAIAVSANIGLMVNLGGILYRNSQ